MDNLYINLDDGSWSVDRAGKRRNEVLDFNQGDTAIAMRLWFVRQASGPALYTIVRKPTQFAAMHLSGRAAEDLESASKLLFDAGTWVEVLSGGEYHYEGDLDLNTVNIDTHLGTATEKDVLWQFEFSNAAPARRWTPIVRGKGVLYRDIFRDTDTPGSVPIGYPDPEDIALNTGTNYRIVDNVLQILNTGTGTWHEIHLTGAAGSEQLVISGAA